MSLNQRLAWLFSRKWSEEDPKGILTAINQLTSRAEKRLVYFRWFIVVLNSLLFFLLPERLVTYESLALTLIVISWVYSLALILIQAKAFIKTKPAKWIAYICDGLMLTCWIASTGGFNSPFFLVYYLGIVGFAFGNTTVLVYSFGFIYAIFYTFMSMYFGDFEPMELIYRCTIMVFAAGIGEIIVTESVAQAVNKEKYQEKIREAEKLRDFFAGMQDELENAVKERTVELAASNIRLEAEIRKRIEIELALKKSIGETDRANLAKAEFLSNISHEIRTPLNAVLGYSDLLVESHFEPKERDTYAKAVRKNGKLLAAIIGDILDLSKIVNGAVHLERNNVEIAALLGEVSDLFDFEVLKKSLELKVSISKCVPATVTADHTRLKQILVNLVGNAVKFTQMGAVTIAVDVIEKTKFLSFSVVDTGIGIPLDRHGRIFDPFTQVDSSTSKKYSGTGLGLTISRALAHKMGGRLVLKESKLGNGSTFSLHIPVLGTVFQLGAETEKTAVKKQLAGLKVLVVDDALDNQILLQHMLKSFGAGGVELAADGAEGIRLGLIGKYDLILMDLQMPRVDGFQATTALRESGIVTPIIAVTAHDMAEVKERVMAGGFSEFIAKPVVSGVLISTIAGVLRKKSEPVLESAHTEKNLGVLENISLI